MMVRKTAVPQWFKDLAAVYRAMRAAGDLSPSEMLDLLADGIQQRHGAGDPFGRAIWADYAERYERDVSSAPGFPHPDLFETQVLTGLGLPPLLDLGGFGRKVGASDARHTDVRKYRDELARKRESWDRCLDRQIGAADRVLAILPADDSRMLREVIADPGDDGHDAVAL